MSLRQVLTIYNAERQLNEDDVALLNTLRRLNDNDRELLVQGLSDKSQKKSSKKTAGGSGKSKRAAELGDTIRSRSQRKATTNGDDGKCVYQHESGAMCFEPADANVHHLETAEGHHGYQPPASSAARAGD